jgi:hypothetical protein
MGARQSSPWNSLSALVSLRKGWTVEGGGSVSRLSFGNHSATLWLSENFPKHGKRGHILPDFVSGFMGFGKYKTV